MGERVKACTCGKPRSWPWLFCGNNLCNFTPTTFAIRDAAYKRRLGRRAPTNAGEHG